MRLRLRETRADGLDQATAREVFALRGNLQESFRALEGSAIIDGVLLEGVAVSASAADVVHTLGRAWSGYVVVAANAQVDVWDTASADETKILRLVASGAATVSLWVF